MQLQKTARKSGRPAVDSPHKLVRLEKFNPVMPKGVEMISANLVFNMDGPTHVAFTVRRVK